MVFESLKDWETRIEPYKFHDETNKTLHNETCETIMKPVHEITV